MNERYSKLYSLPQNLYADEMPVVISAGALLKDNMTGKVLAQLKIKNIGDRAIKALTVRLHMFDIASKPLGGSFEYQYLDLDVQRDMEFGTQTPIFLPDHTVRSYSVSVVNIIFSNNEEWQNQNTDCDWKQLPESVDLVQGLGDAALATAYQSKFGEACKYLPVQQDGFWVCSCGHINYQSEETCPYCQNALADFLNPELANELEQIAEGQAIEGQKKARKKTIQIISAALIALIIAIPSIVLIYNSLPSTKFKQAIEYLDIYGDYEEAYFILIEDKVAVLEGADEAYRRCIYKWMDDYWGYMDALAIIIENKISSPMNTGEILRDYVYQLLDEGKYKKAYSILIYIEDNGSVLNNAAELRRECIYQWSDWIYQDLDCSGDSWLESCNSLSEYEKAELRIDEPMWDWIYQKVIYVNVSDYESRHVKIKLLSYLPDSAFQGIKELRGLLDCAGLGWSDQQKWFTENQEFVQQMWDEFPTLWSFVESNAIIKYFLMGEWSDGRYNGYYFNMDEDRSTSFNLPTVSKPTGTKYYDIKDLIYYWEDENSNHLADVFKITILDYDWIFIESYKDGEIYSLHRE